MLNFRTASCVTNAQLVLSNLADYLCLAALQTTSSRSIFSKYFPWLKCCDMPVHPLQNLAILQALSFGATCCWLALGAYFPI